ncbi:UNVERIFIED_CONTAM: hypothetical protein GTU68_052438 [Idotea baltica]|nr:hypothetical protein [Idotea baltica]
MIIPFIVLALILLSGVFTVKQQTIALVERLGKFHSIKGPGLQFKIPFIDRVAGKVNLKINQLDVLVETKTKDNVFVKLKVSVQFRVLQDAVYDAFYKLENPLEQITSYVFDTVRAEVPKIKLDDVFERKDDIANAVRREMEEAMTEYGYGIVKALVTDIDPDHEVKISMNRISQCLLKRRNCVQNSEGEADAKSVLCRRLEAEAGVGLQGQWSCRCSVVKSHKV